LTRFDATVDHWQGCFPSPLETESQRGSSQIG